jgi:signal transduction histidine kinase
MVGGAAAGWRESASVLPLTIVPLWWQRTSVRAAGALSAALLLGGIVWLVARMRLRRKLARLQLQHARESERMRIAKDIHDDLGSSLTRIMLLGQRADSDLAERKEVGLHLKKIVNLSRGTIQAMDEIVWAVNPRNDNLDGLVGYLNEYTAQLFQDTQIRCRLQLPITSQLTLRTEVRHELFLAFKEALNNVLKHSMASEVHVEVFQSESAVSIIIDDNGCGFDPAREQNGRQGNGLPNMRKRMDALGGRMEITTAPGHGTKLQFTVPVLAQTPSN